MEQQPCIEMRGIGKSFFGVNVLEDVELVVQAGTVHAVIGENGAGKSTLMKILTGIYVRECGEICIDGLPVEISSPQDAMRHGISIVEQELVVFQDLTVLQNIFAGRELFKAGFPMFDWRRMRSEAKRVLEPFSHTINVDAPMKHLKVSDRQIVEIAKAVSFHAKYIVMDEPTSSLGEKEKNTLFAIIRQVKQAGVGVVYISHRMEEIYEIADCVTVMRDGRRMGTWRMCDITQKELIRRMVGRPIAELFNREKHPEHYGEVVLSVHKLSRMNHFSDISFEVRSGEILGMYGLIGSQRSEIVKCIFGIDSFSSGEVRYFGKLVRFKSSRDAIRNGIGLVPEDRKREGIVHTMSVLHNLSLAMLPVLGKRGWIDRKSELTLSESQVQGLAVKLKSVNQKIVNLSGGNQQKVILARFLAMKPRLLILDEPTRGIDIGAKAEIHKIIDRIASQGVAVILISSEMPEIIGACDRIVVLHEGRLASGYRFDEVTQELLMASAL